MIRQRILTVAAVLMGLFITGTPAVRAAGPPAALPDSPAGTWRLVPLTNSRVPAAWVINTETGDTYLCGTGSFQGKATIACLEAVFPPSHAK
jgi:hypothetical protein